VEFVVAVEDDIVIVRKLGGEVLPEGTEVAGGCEDVTTVSAEVLGIKNGVGTSGSNEFDDSLD
jgi:hypothetical protein